MHEITCDSGRCIKASSKCDGRNDCGDNSDEHACGELNTITQRTKAFLGCHIYFDFVRKIKHTIAV